MINHRSVILSNRKDSNPGLLGIKNASLLLAVSMLLHVTGARVAETTITDPASFEPLARKLEGEDQSAD
jgi:hypothetical protein